MDESALLLLMISAGFMAFGAYAVKVHQTNVALRCATDACVSISKAGTELVQLMLKLEHEKRHGYRTTVTTS